MTKVSQKMSAKESRKKGHKFKIYLARSCVFETNLTRNAFELKR